MDLIRPSTLEDVYEVALNMRREDVDECQAGGLAPYDALLAGFCAGCTYTLMAPDGSIAGMLGVSKRHAEAQDGLIWLLATSVLVKHQMAFLRRCRPVLEHLYEESGCELLWNHTHKPNIVHHKWLKWLGFTFLREVGDFYEFARLKGNVR